MMPLTVGAIYEQVKTGNRYRLIACGKDVHDLSDLVVYEALYENKVSKVWVRPKNEFLGEAQSPDGTIHPRFRLVSET